METVFEGKTIKLKETDPLRRGVTRIENSRNVPVKLDQKTIFGKKNCGCNGKKKSKRKK